MKSSDIIRILYTFLNADHYVVEHDLSDFYYRRKLQFLVDRMEMSTICEVFLLFLLILSLLLTKEKQRLCFFLSFIADYAQMLLMSGTFNRIISVLVICVRQSPFSFLMVLSVYFVVKNSAETMPLREQQIFYCWNRRLLIFAQMLAPVCLRICPS